MYGQSFYISKCAELYGGTLVTRCSPWMFFICSFNASYTLLCCFIIDSPLKSLVSTYISNIAPQPPDASLTLMFVALGNLLTSMSFISSSEVRWNVLFGPYHILLKIYKKLYYFLGYVYFSGFLHCCSCFYQYFLLA